MSNESPVTASEFTQRLAALCGAPDRGFPRKNRDRHILFRSVMTALSQNHRYSEPELKLALGRWSEEVGAGIGIDHVTLRRYLVDWGYLRRDRGGEEYSVCPDGAGDVLFDSDVDGVDPADVVRDAREEAESRKRLWRRGGR